MGSLWRRSRPLVLASKSQVRRELLEAAGIPLELASAAIDERAVEAPLLARNAAAEDVAAHLARAKAGAVAREHPDDLVLGADQTLACNGKIFSKPKDRSSAAAQLAMLAGQTHALHSAICLMRGDVCVFETAETAYLTCRPFDTAFIESYLAAAGDGVLASVGAYQLESLGIHLFERIDGDYTTILGLPLLPLLAFLRSEGSLLA
jgi:septum formation protein